MNSFDPLIPSGLRIHVGRRPKWNPCPCGFYGDSKRECRCSTRQIENYRQRISGPLLDRIDLHVEVPLVGTGSGQPQDPARSGSRGGLTCHL